jgi:hypothetical protein
MSTLKADTIQNTSGGAVTLTKQEAVKMWTRHNSGTAIGSFNQSSITDNASGDYTLNFTNSFSDTDYCLTSSARIFSSTAGSMITYGIKYDSAGTHVFTGSVRTGGSAVSAVTNRFAAGGGLNASINGDLA